MIQPTALIGFIIAAVAAAWTISAVLGAAVFLAAKLLRHLGPCAERKAAVAALLVPPGAGLFVALVMAGRSLFGPWLGLADHCTRHAHHLHLCLHHGGAWAQKPWVVAFIVGLGTWVVTRLLRGIARHRDARRQIGALKRLGRPDTTSEGTTVIVVPDARVFCFVAESRGSHVFVSTGAWNELGAAEREAVIAHELAHAEQRDVLTRRVLAVAAMFGVPLVSGALVRLWGRATERLCDARAARISGPTAVAQALLNLARGVCADRSAAAWSPGFSATGDEIVDRIEELLRERSDGARPARWIARVSSAAFLVAAVATIVYADPLHHLLETVLGVV